MHSPTKILMGATQSSFKNVDNRKGTIDAGLAVRLKSDDTISLASADGPLLGISLGKGLSDTGRTAIVRKGVRVPVRLTASFSPAIGGVLNISDTTGLAIAAGAGATATQGVFVSQKLIAVLEDGTEVADGVALVDFPGGL